MVQLDYYKKIKQIIMNERTNKDLTVLCTSTGNSAFVGAQQVASNPAANSALGKSGDYYWEDPSLYFKVSTGWVAIDPSGVTAL